MTLRATELYGASPNFTARSGVGVGEDAAKTGLLGFPRSVRGPCPDFLTTNAHTSERNFLDQQFCESSVTPHLALAFGRVRFGISWVSLSFVVYHSPSRPGRPIATAYSAGVLRDKGRLFPVCFATLPTSISGVRPVGFDRYAPSEARVRGRLDPYIRPSEPFGSPPGR